METGFGIIVLLVATTSTAAYALTRSTNLLTRRSLRQAVASLLEWAGLFVLFFGANLAVGTVLILLIRGFTPRFISIYELENVLVWILSAGQAFVIQHCWRRT
jgi:hypothetical protein